MGQMTPSHGKPPIICKLWEKQNNSRRIQISEVEKEAMKKIFSMLGGFLLATAFAMPSWGDIPRDKTANPGALNYVEGQVSIGSEALSPNSVGSTLLQPGESIATGKGKAELLLTPGVFVRLGDDSSLTMVSPNLTNTAVQLNRGEATLEVDQIFKENNIRVAQSSADTRITKQGLYDFDADEGQIRVFDGQAIVSASGKEIKVKGGRELALNATAGPLKARSFNKDAFAANDDLYRWSSLRSAYVAEANASEAPYYTNGWYGPGWVGTGWYWAPWFGCYTFIPGDGMFWGPFGWGFYSPWYAGGIPFYGYYGYGGRYYHRFSHAYRPPALGAHNLGFRGGTPGGFGGGPEFQGGGSTGGGFHGGGFAGGGFGGGRGR